MIATQTRQTEKLNVKPDSSELVMSPEIGTHKSMVDFWDEDRIDVSADRMDVDELIEYLFPARSGYDKQKSKNCDYCGDINEILSESFYKNHRMCASSLTQILEMYCEKKSFQDQKTYIQETRRNFARSA